jgi:hypothetical protein
VFQTENAVQRYKEASRIKWNEENTIDDW